MTTFNVRVSVVELVDAASEEEACDIVERRLRALDFTVYGTSDAFESERP